MTTKPLTDWLARNHTWFLGALLIAVCIATAMIPGCGLLDPAVAVPRRVQTDLGAPESVPLSEAKGLLDEYLAKCEARIGEEAATLRILGESINRAETTAENWRSALWLGIEQGQQVAGVALPPLAPVLSIATLIAGLFIPKPGTRKKIEQAQDEAAAKVATAIANAGDPVATARYIASSYGATVPSLDRANPPQTPNVA